MRQDTQTILAFIGVSLSDIAKIAQPRIDSPNDNFSKAPEFPTNASTSGFVASLSLYSFE